jgi:uncharacterized membrane protein YdjX (TVP38/TMEM64 family)
MSTSAEPAAQLEPSPPSRRPTWSRWLLAGILVLLIAGFFALGLQRYFSLEYVRANLDYWKQQTEQDLLLSLVIFFAVYVTVTGLSLPVAVWLSLTAGFLFGRWVGTAVVLLAATCGATLAFLSSRYLFRDSVQQRFGERLRSLNQGVARDGAFYLFALRLVPAVPYFLINLGMGLTPMRVWTFVWVTLVGMLPGTFAYVNAGGALRDIQKPSDILSPDVVLALALLGLLPLLLRLLVIFLRKGRSHEPPTPTI